MELKSVTEADATLQELTASLATELALGISDRGHILERHGISPEKWELLRQSPVFRQMLVEAVRQWRSDLNAPQRTKLKAQVLAEDGLTAMDRLVHDQDITPTARIEAFKTITRVAGVHDTETADTGGGFQVNINIGNGQGVTIEGNTDARQISEN